MANDKISTDVSCHLKTVHNHTFFFIKKSNAPVYQIEPHNEFKSHNMHVNLIEMARKI